MTSFRFGAKLGDVGATNGMHRVWELLTNYRAATCQSKYGELAVSSVEAVGLCPIPQLE